MRKVLLCTAVATALLVPAFAAESLEGAFKDGKASGQIRLFYINRDYSEAYESAGAFDRWAFAAGGYMKFETAPLYGFSAAAAAYTTNDFGWSDDNFNKIDPILFGENKDGYTILGEAYLQYKTGNTLFKAGRQKLETPLAGSDDARMLPNLFEAYLIQNTDLADTTLIAAHVTKFAAGTFSNSYKADNLALISGYGLKTDGTGKFVNMGAQALGNGYETDGVTTGAIIYNGVKNLTLQAWDYYAYDILNAIYLQADYSWNCLLNNDIKMTASAQYINESDVGDDLVGRLKSKSGIDADYYALQLAVAYKNAKLTGAYSQTGENSDAALEGSIITPWGGMPAFTQGMVTRHQFSADTDAWKVSGSYNFKEHGPDLLATLYYASYDLGASNVVVAGDSFTAKESGFDLIYNPARIKNLQLRLRGNFTEDFAAYDKGWDEYRLIANYNF